MPGKVRGGRGRRCRTKRSIRQQWHAEVRGQASALAAIRNGTDIHRTTAAANPNLGGRFGRAQRIQTIRRQARAYKGA